MTARTVMRATFYRCHACGFTAGITEQGVDSMRAHLREHDGDPRLKARDVYAEARVRDSGRAA